MDPVQARAIRAADVLRPGSRWGDCEIWDGIPLVRDPSGGLAEVVAAAVVGPLQRHVLAGGHGWTFLSSQGFLLARDPDRLLAADGAYVSRARLAAVPATGFVELAPDFLLEVRSPRDTWEGVVAKCGIWIAHGAGCAWALDPETRTVAVFRPGEDVQVRRRRGRVDAGPVLPDFALDLETIFAALG